MLWSLVTFDIQIKDQWSRRYEGKKKESRFYSGEGCMKPEVSLYSQYACDTHLKAILKTDVI